MSTMPLVKDFGDALATDNGYEVVTVDGQAVAGVMEYDLTGASPWVRVRTDGSKDAFGHYFSEIKQLKQGAFVRTVNNTKPPWGVLEDDGHNFYLGDICGATTPEQALIMGRREIDGERRWFPISEHLGITDTEDARAIDAYVNEGGFALEKMDFGDAELRVLAHMGSVTGRVRHDAPNYADEPRHGRRDWQALYMGEYVLPSKEECEDPNSRHFTPVAICPRMISMDIDRMITPAPMRPYHAASQHNIEIKIVVDGRGTFGANDREVMADIAKVLEKHYPSASRFNNKVRRL